MKKAFFAIIAIMLLAFTGQAFAYDKLDALVDQGRIKINILIDPTPWDQKVSYQWNNVVLQTPAQINVNDPAVSATGSFSFYRASHSVARKTTPDRSELNPRHNIGLEYYSLKYEIQPNFVRVEPVPGRSQDTQFIYKFTILKGVGANLTQCHSTGEFKLLLPDTPTEEDAPARGTEDEMLPGSRGYKYVTVDALSQCGIRFQVYRTHSWFGDHVWFLRFDFSRNEIINYFLPQLLQNTADASLKQSITEIIGAQLPPTKTCTPKTCAEMGWECGSGVEDRCNTTIQCQACPSGKTCNNSIHKCETFSPPCVPKTCSELGWQCGTGDDGCGGTLNCGDCPTGQKCNIGTHKCCTPKTCAEMGWECGSGIESGCNNTINCGNCTGGKTCNTETHKCVSTCVPKTCSELGWQCGTGDDGCGGTLNCG
ncbi:MAG: hypothetical protein QXK06_05740, partial [Candidatus Diapherotrites archaeon]